MGSCHTKLIVFFLCSSVVLTIGSSQNVVAQTQLQTRHTQQTYLPSRYRRPSRTAYATDAARRESYSPNSQSQRQPRESQPRATAQRYSPRRATNVRPAGYSQLMLPKNRSVTADGRPRPPLSNLERAFPLPMISAGYATPKSQLDQDDPFGENQTLGLPPAKPPVTVRPPALPGGQGLRNDDIFSEDQNPNNPFSKMPAQLEPKVPTERRPPELPEDGQFMPDPGNNQILPRPSDTVLPRGNSLRQQDERLREELRQLEQERLEREEERAAEERRERRKRGQQRRRKLPKDWGNDEIEYQEGSRPPSEGAPNADNGPDSWYRPRMNPSAMPSNQIPSQTPSQSPYGFSEPGIYAAPPAPGASHAYSAPGQQIPNGQPAYQPDAIAAYPAAAAPPIYQGVMSGNTMLPSCADGGCVDPCGKIGGINSNCPSVFYLSFFGGYTGLESLKVDEEIGSSLFETDAGYGLGAAIGQFQGPNLRTEIEFSYRNNNVSELELIGNSNLFGRQAIDGEIQSYAGLANVVWEFIEFPSQRVKPYVGAGFGFVSVETDLRLGGQSINTDGSNSDSSFAYQWIAGLNYKASETFDLFVEYRFLKADSLRMETTGVSDTPPNGSGSFDYQTNNVFGGVRVNF